MDIKQKFKVYCSTNLNELNKSLIEDTFAQNDELILEGIASTTNIDEDEDFMTKECLEDLKRQAIGLSVLKHHGRTLDDIIGKVVGIPDTTSDVFKIRFKVLPRWKYYLEEFIENEINLGLSIGAKALEYEPNKDSDYGWKVNKAKLYEISLVPLPSNWDSFGSVKVSKELDNDDDTVIAKCFNGACKLMVKEYSKNMNKELEDTQKKEDEKYLTEQEVVNLINELGISMYDRLLSEIIDETKRMIEKYHLDKDGNNESSNSNDNENINDNSSKKKEDEEKNKNMSEENGKNIKNEETPNVQKEMGELEKEASTGEEVNNGKTDDVKVEVPDLDTVIKSIEELKTSLNKGIDEDINAKVDAKLEEFKKSLPDVEELKKSIRKEVEEELFKELTTERTPTETEQPEVKEENEESREEEENMNKAMNSRDIAKLLCS